MRKPYLVIAFLMGTSVLSFGDGGSAQHRATPYEVQDQTKPKVEISGPLGSDTNPVRCDFPKGERQYLNRLRCADGEPPTYSRIGSFGLGPYGNVLDGYKVKCEGRDDVTIFMDMYHQKYVETEAVPSFTIVN